MMREENVFSPCRRQEGISCFLVERRRGKRACLTTLLDYSGLSMAVGGWIGIEVAIAQG